jgi:multifunctional beta-oxidation protein
MAELRFDGKVVVVTGAGGGLGRQYALYYGARGASVVVNDLGGSLKGEADSSGGKRVADHVVDEIKALGGNAVANYDSVENGDRIVETAVKAFGTVHIVINNAGILRDISMKKMTEKDFRFVQLVHVYGSYKVARAAWPYMRKQKYGRIINTASAAGLYGNFGQANYSAAKLALVGFTFTLAREGAKYNITANAIAPLAQSRMTETVMPPDILEMIKPDFVVPVVAYLTHENSSETGGVFETAGGVIKKLRWQRSKGAAFRCDDSFTPSAVLARFDEISDFDNNPEYPEGSQNVLEYAENSNNLPPNKQGESISFQGKVAVVTGAGAGIGREYALLLAKLGAKVVVNDFVNPQAVVDEIVKAGGIAVGDKNNVVEGDKVIKTALDNFGAVHIVINNAGILRDKSFANMSDDEWKMVNDVHLYGTFAVTRAAWPHFLNQKYGRIINTTSTSGIYGNFGQANYSAAKLGILGFTKTCAIEGQKYNIFANAVAPTAGTAMTATVFNDDMLDKLKPKYIAPITALLASEKAPVNGKLIETGAGWVAMTRWQRSKGAAIRKDKLTVEKVAANWDKVNDFNTDTVLYPETTAESSMDIFGALEAANSGEDQDEPEFSSEGDFVYDERSIVLYNLGVGAKATDLKYSYEASQDFGPVATFPVLGLFSVHPDYGEIVPNFNPMKLLHGEQYTELHQWPLPSAANVKVKLRTLDVVDKGKAAVVSTISHGFDSETNEKLFTNIMTVFIRGSGGFGGKTVTEDRGAITAANTPPKRIPDFTEDFKTSEDQAALYRLSGDFNPLHIDPDMAALGNFPRPILHGLCTMGISARILTDKFGPLKNIKVRFTGHVFPGETLRVNAWKEGGKVIFETKVVERGTTAISAAAIELNSNGGSKL